MKKLTITLFILLIIGILSWCLFAQKDNSPHLIITSPSGGEIWQTGEEHTITWETDKVPEDYMVSVSIQRIPPPPLQEEGQEFDPVIFTNLPNTGNVMWEIHPMYPNGSYVLNLHAYNSLPATDEITIKSEVFTIVNQEIAEALNLTYSNADWQPAKAETITIGEEILVGFSTVSTAIDAGMDPSSIFMPFESYYENKLTELGWTIRNDLAAGGPMGGQTGYTKDGQIILIRYQTTFQNVTNTAPSECPCEVTLSVFATE